MDSDTRLYVINILRKGTITWSGRREALRLARKRVWDGTYFKNGKKKYKFQWICSTCLNWFLSEQEMEVDHKVEIGPFDGSWDNYINKLYCDPDKDLQCLCISCHAKKTAKYNSSRTAKRISDFVEETIIPSSET